MRIGCITLTAALALVAPCSGQGTLSTVAASIPTRADNYDKLPLSFEPNHGQTDARVQFLSHQSGHVLFLTSTEAVLRTQRDVFRMKLVGANPGSRAEGTEPQIGRSNYFIGSDPAKWRTGIPNYSRVRFAGVYPGIDLVYYGKDRRLEYDWIVQPGADPSKIRLRFAGVKSMRVDRNGDLVLKTASGEIRQKKPVVYQTKEIAGRYVIRHGHEAGFEVGSYDTAKPLVIDPVLVYSTYLGGFGNDSGTGIAVDSAGHAYVFGTTGSPNFPTVPPQQVSISPGFFLSKLSADGKSLLFSTFLGGIGGSSFGPPGFAMDSAGNFFLTGSVAATADFPLVNAYQSHATKSTGYYYSAFVVKLNPTASALLFSTYLGGSKDDQGTGIAVDPAGNAYVTGYTVSSDFPTVNPIQSTLGGTGDAFVSKFSADGSTLQYSTYVGGDGADEPRGIAVDIGGNAYITGSTVSTNFPTVNPFQTNSGNAFVTKINPTGSAFVYSSYLGGALGVAIAADSSGNAFVTGAGAGTLPGQMGINHGSLDAFVTKINATGSAVHSVFIGGTSSEKGLAIAVNASGQPWVTGLTTSSDFPTVNPLMTARPNGVTQIFVSQLSADLSTLLFSTYISGDVINFDADDQEGRAIAVDVDGNAYVTGLTGSSVFPTTANAVQTVFGGPNFGFDAFVLKISGAVTQAPSTITATSGTPQTAPVNTAFASALLATVKDAGGVGVPNAVVTFTVVPNNGAGGSFAGGVNTATTNSNGQATSAVFTANGTAGSYSVVASSGAATGATFSLTNTAVSLPPSLGINKSHSGNFAAGQRNATYQIAVMNANGAGPTDGSAVTVTDLAPSGMTLVSMSGTGWTCPGTAANNCTRANVLLGGSSYPPIVVTVNVAANATSPQVNAATVSGGGSASSRFNDSTNITAKYPSRDFDGNGVPDLIWQNNVTRQVNVNYFGGAGGASVIGWNPLLTAPGWHVAAVADFDGNGIPDLVWINDTTNEVHVVYHGGSGGTSVIGFNVLYPAGYTSGWHIVGAGDFNGDGVPDLVWQNDTTGQVNVNYFGGTAGAAVTGFAVLYPPGFTNGWRAAAVADFNRDGVSDVLWQNNTTAQVNVNYFGGSGGASLIGFNVLYSPGFATGWHIISALDMDNNGTPDVLWQNDSTGQVNVNYFGGAGGTSLLGFNVLYAAGLTSGWTAIR